MADASRDQVVGFVRDWSERTEIRYEQLLWWTGLSGRKFRDWRETETTGRGDGGGAAGV